MISTISVNFEQLIEDFMRKNEQEVKLNPNIPKNKIVMLRHKLIKEESRELMDAIRCDNMIEIADGCADIMVVTIGTALAYGIPINNVFLEIHESNMTKEGKREDGKVTKGPNYRAPDLQRILKSAGWEGK